MSSVRLPLVAKPYDYSAVPSTAKPRTYPLGGHMVKIENGQWQVASDWIEAAG